MDLIPKVPSYPVLLSRLGRHQVRVLRLLRGPVFHRSQGIYNRRFAIGESALKIDVHFPDDLPEIP